jgi:hypothetical protein
VSPPTRRSPGVQSPGPDEIELAADHHQQYRSLLAERLAAAALVLDVMIRRRPDIDDATLDEVRTRMLARAVAGAGHHRNVEVRL